MPSLLPRLACSLLLLAACSRPDPAPAPPAPDARAAAALPLDAAHTDVLLIALCTMRADRLGMYGHDKPTSPFMDQLAAEGVLFTENFSQAPWTRPGMGAIMAGRWPRAMRLDNPGRKGFFSMKVAEGHTLLAEALGAQGYATVGAVANPNLKTKFGFAQGFDHYFEPEHTYKKAEERPPSGREIVDALLAMEAQVPDDQRLYARAVILDPHHAPRFDPAHLPAFDGQKKRLQRYDAAVRTVDDQVQRLVTELRARRPNLLVVVAADHGEGLRLPGHHGPEHGNHVYRTTVQTPLFFHHPSLGGAGTRVDALSMNIDIHPTVLDLLGLSVDHPVDGRSLAPVLRGETTETGHEVVFAETFFRKVHKATAYDGAHQLVRIYEKGGVAGLDGPRTDHLYAAADWRAEHDLAAAEPELTAGLAAALSTWEAEQARLAGMEGAGDGVDLDDETRRMLEQLGYIQPGEDLDTLEGGTPAP